MAFEPIEFFRLAEYLYSEQKNQAGYRATIGRAYYAAMLSARNKAGLSSKGANGHETVVKYYKSSSDANLAAIGNRLDDLRVSRTNSDYECDKVVVSRDAGASIAKSRTILNALGFDLNEIGKLPNPK